MQTAVWSLMNSLGLFPAGRADAERRNMFLYPPVLFFLPASNLIQYYRCGEGKGGWLKRGASRDDTLLTLLALILMPHARGLYTIHFNAISACQEGWVIQWEHNCILKFLHWFIPVAVITFIHGLMHGATDRYSMYTHWGTHPDTYIHMKLSWHAIYHRILPDYSK